MDEHGAVASQQLSSLEVAAVLEELFQTVLDENGDEYSMAHVARECARMSGLSFTKEYVRRLRKGIVPNPSSRHLGVLADFWGVPVDAFFRRSAARELHVDLKLARLTRDAGVEAIALRAMEFDVEEREELVDYMKHMKKRRQRRLTNSDPEAPAEQGDVSQ